MGEFGLLYGLDKAHKRAKMLFTFSYSFIGCSVSGSETHPSCSCTVWAATDTFFLFFLLFCLLNLSVPVPLQFWLLPEGFCLCCHCGSKALFNIIDYFFCGSFNQFLLQSIEAERFYIRLDLIFLGFSF